MLCMQRMRHRGRLREELEWSSAPFTPLKYSSKNDTLCFLSLPTLCSVSHGLSSPSHFSSLCDMWSFHFIPGWLSGALKHWCCPPIPSCSIAGGTGFIDLYRSVPVPCDNSSLNFQSLSAVGQTFSTSLYYFASFLFYLCACDTLTHHSLLVSDNV